MNLTIKELSLLQKLSIILIYCLVCLSSPAFPPICETSYVSAVLSFLQKVQQFQGIIVLN